MQTKLIITTAALLGLAAPAHAQLFTPGGTYSFNIQNSPGTSNNLVTFTPGTQLIDGGDVALTLTIVNAADFATTGAQWIVLQTQTVGGVALSQPGENWSFSAVGLPAAEADQLHCRLQPVDRHQRGEHPADRPHLQPAADQQSSAGYDRNRRRLLGLRCGHSCWPGVSAWRVC